MIDTIGPADMFTPLPAIDPDQRNALRLAAAERMARAFAVIDKGRGADVLKGWQDMRAALAEWEALKS